jgi:hypothetical protein
MCYEINVEFLASFCGVGNSEVMDSKPRKSCTGETSVVEVYPWRCLMYGGEGSTMS